MFLPLIVTCHLMNPDQCTIRPGPMMETRDMCLLSLMGQGIPAVSQLIQNTEYIAGIGCIDVDIRDDPV